MRSDYSGGRYIVNGGHGDYRLLTQGNNGNVLEVNQSSNGSHGAADQIIVYQNGQRVNSGNEKGACMADPLAKVCIHKGDKN